MSNITVRLEKIKYAGWENLEVAIDVNAPKDLYLTYPTAEIILNYRVNSLREKIASKSLKTFLGKALVLGKFTGTIVNKKTDGTPKVALISLEDFLAVATWEASVNQNIRVAQTLAAGFGDSIRSIAYEQLGITLGLEERHAWIVDRLEVKELFWEFTTAIKLSRKAAGKEISFFHYSTPVDAINRGLFGKTAKQIKEELGNPVSLTRDSFGRKALRRISAVQEAAAVRISRGEKPCDAVANCIASFFYEIIDFRI
jgi:hypothetical protein